MKKLICLILSAVLPLSAGACGAAESAVVPVEPQSAAAPPAVSSSGDAEDARDDGPVPMPAFTTTDLQGETVTEDIFTGYDLTVVNVWATYCAPCVSEMPALGEWAREMPENVQLIAIASDVLSDAEPETRELAAKILEEADAPFRCLTVSEGLYWLFYAVPGVPTTFFVDGQGRIVGNAVLGAQVSLYKERVEQLLSAASEADG